MFFSNSKGNVVALAIIVTIVLVGTAAFMVGFYQTQPPEVPISTALSETTISINKAIALGISRWTETGFDQENPVWYNNGNFPSPLEEAKQSLRDTVKEEIAKVLEGLHNQRGYTFEFDDPAKGIVLEFDFDNANSISALDKKSMKVKVSGFSVKDEKGNIITTKEFATELNFDYAVWELYDKMYEWATQDSGDFSLHLQELIDKTPYQLQLCDCGIITKITEDKTILKGSISWEDRTDPDNGSIIQGIKSYVIDSSLEKLKEKFAGNPSITCSYAVEDNAIENIPNILKRGQAGCDCLGGIGLDNTTQLMGSAVAAWRTDEIGKPELYYGVKNSKGEMRENANTQRGFPTIESFLKIERTTPIPGLVYNNCNLFNVRPEDKEICIAGRMCFHTDAACIKSYKDAGQTYLAIQGDNEIIGMTRRIAGLLRFKCEDSSSKVKTEDSFKSLSAEIVVRFAILKGAEPPDFCTTEQSALGCMYGGGSSQIGIIGLECTPWDSCSSNAQDAAACGICECMVGSQIVSKPGNSDSLGDEEAKTWCNSKGGSFKCPAKAQYSETTPDCQALINETVTSRKSEQCLLYNCVVEDNTVKRGCVFQTNPVPCDSCRRCDTDGYCVPDAAKINQMCVPQPAPVGADQTCYGCTLEGSCVVNANAVGTAICSNSEGCKTYCSDSGTCSMVKPEDIGLQCPTNKPDYLCKQCGIKNNKLLCGTICQSGCCSDRSNDWGRCLTSTGKCCPETRTLTDCPAPT